MYKQREQTPWFLRCCYYYCCGCSSSNTECPPGVSPGFRQPLHSSIHPPIPPSTHPSLHPSIHPSGVQRVLLCAGPGAGHRAPKPQSTGFESASFPSSGPRWVRLLVADFFAERSRKPKPRSRARGIGGGGPTWAARERASQRPRAFLNVTETLKP